MAYGIVLLPTFRQPSVSCSILQLFDYLCHYSHCHLLSIRLGIRCLSCSVTFWLSQTCCFLSAQMHSCYLCKLTTYADCHMFNYCLSFHTSPLCKFLPFVLSAYQTLLAAYFPCSHLIAIVHQCLHALSLYFFYTCVLFVLCTLLASCMLVQPCTLIVPCTLIAYFHPMCHCDPFHTGHFILTSRFCFLVAVRALPTLGTLPFAHGPPCSMHLLTICNTILVWGILVAHLTPLSHRCSLHYVQSQFSLTHHFLLITF